MVIPVLIANTKPAQQNQRNSRYYLSAPGRRRSSCFIYQDIFSYCFIINDKALGAFMQIAVFWDMIPNL